jgi:hypothetical protein
MEREILQVNTDRPVLLNVKFQKWPNPTPPNQRHHIAPPLPPPLNLEISSYLQQLWASPS